MVEKLEFQMPTETLHVAKSPLLKDDDLDTAEELQERPTLKVVVAHGTTLMQRLWAALPLYSAILLITWAYSIFSWLRFPELQQVTLTFTLIQAVEEDQRDPMGIRPLSDARLAARVVRSSEMFDHLIRPTRPGDPSMENIRDRTELHSDLMSRVLVTLKDQDLVAVSIADEDGQRALAMGTAIFQRTQEILEEQAMAAINRKVEIYGAFAQKADEHVKTNVRALLDAAEELKADAGNRSIDGGAQDPLRKSSEALVASVAQLTSSTADLQRDQEKREALLVMLNAKDMPTLRLVQEPMLEPRTDPWLRLATDLLYKALILALVIGALVLYWHMYGKDLKLSLHELNTTGSIP